jgi:hypothetical protein
MNSPDLYRRVVSDLLAVEPFTGRFVTVLRESVIETPGDNSKPGLRRVLLNGQGLLVFNRDIQERTEPRTCT